MTDKPDAIFLKIDQLLAQCQQSLEEVRIAVSILGQIPPAELEEHAKRAKRSNIVHHVMQGLMSGRWHRRDGDSYGIVREPGEPRPNADNPSGNL